MLAEVDAQNRLTSELAPGERMLWSGAPDCRRLFYPEDAALVPFSLLWGGFAIFWEANALSSASARDTVLFPLWGVPFVLVGLYLIIGRFFLRKWLRRRTLYALTDRRVVSIAPSWPRGERVTSVWLSSYPPVEKTLRADGNGTLWIGSMPSRERRFAQTGWPGAQAEKAVVFSDIPDAAAVCARLQQLLSDATSAPATGVGLRS